MLSGNPSLLAIGVIAVFIGLFLITLSLIKGGGERSDRRTEAGGIIIIGPVPIVFGSNKSAMITAAVVGMALTALAIILTLMLGVGHS